MAQFLNPNKPSHRAILQKKDASKAATKSPRGSRVNMGGKQRKSKPAPPPEDMSAMGGMPPVMAMQNTSATPGFKDGGTANFIAGAIKRPGQLHRDLGVPQGEKIPASKLTAAAKRPGKVGARARFAEMLKGLKHK